MPKLSASKAPIDDSFSFEDGVATWSTAGDSGSALNTTTNNAVDILQAYGEDLGAYLDELEGKAPRED